MTKPMNPAGKCMVEGCFRTPANIFCKAHWDFWNAKRGFHRPCLHPIVLTDDWEIRTQIPEFFLEHNEAPEGFVNLVCSSCSKFFGLTKTSDSCVPKRQSKFTTGLGLHKSEGLAA